MSACLGGLHLQGEGHRPGNGRDEIGGREQLTLAQVTRTIYRARGQSLTSRPIPVPVAALGLTIADPLPFIPMGREQAKAFRYENVTDKNALDAFGIQPDSLITLDDYLLVREREVGKRFPIHRDRLLRLLGAVVFLAGTGTVLDEIVREVLVEDLIVNSAKRFRVDALNDFLVLLGRSNRF
jgi:hypothetical protein